MKIVIAPDKFKASLSAFDFCSAVEEGIRLADRTVEIIKLPLADGGDGTISVIQHYLEGEKIECIVNDPLFRPVKAQYLFSKKHKSAFIEMAEASGLHLLKKEEQNCMYTTTFGTGEMIRDALEKGATEITLGIGGSATCDCGIGMASALGYKFLDKHGQDVRPIGKNLSEIQTVQLDTIYENLPKVKFKVACDVTNPLFGKSGSAYVYGPQKGASDDDVMHLDNGLRHFSKILDATFNSSSSNIIGGGAAGGMGVGGKLFLNASLISGIHMLMEFADFSSKIDGAEWIITGEGMLDHQTVSGKTISGVLEAAKEKNIPVAAFSGGVALSISQQKELGIMYATSILKTVGNLEEAIEYAYENLKYASYNFMNLIRNIK